jgi:hypothetical protein
MEVLLQSQEVSLSCYLEFRYHKPSFEEDSSISEERREQMEDGKKEVDGR